MLADKALVREKLQEWTGKMGEYALPAWQELPTLPLYMDQVIYLMNTYLALLPEERMEDRQVTPAMINNYVKLKIIPPPVKKRYGRLHLAYLIQVCILKQSMNTSEIRHLLPVDMSEEEMQETYAAFISLFAKTKAECLSRVQDAAEMVLREKTAPIAHLIFQTAVSANLFRLLTEQLLSLQAEEKTEDETEKDEK